MSVEQPDSVNANQTDLSSRNDNFNETASQTRSRLPRFARNDGNRGRIAVLLSGTGTLLKSIIDKCPEVEIVAAISDRDAPGLKYAEAAGIPAYIVSKDTTSSSFLSDDNEKSSNHSPLASSFLSGDNEKSSDHSPLASSFLSGDLTKNFRAPSPCSKVRAGRPALKHFPILDKSLDDVIVEILEPLEPDLIVLAGYLKIVGEPLLSRYEGKIINQHPSLLPKFGGLYGLGVHKAVIESGDTITGTTTHFVTKELDAGEVILQDTVVVEPGDTAELLQEKVKRLEWGVLPQAINILMDSCLRRNDIKGE
jgi:formyltetrahydrofolate-dependent phosphoribosylglycinamide formyltransferase